MTGTPPEHLLFMEQPNEKAVYMEEQASLAKLKLDGR